MNITGLELVRFMGHDMLGVKVPSKGVVLVTGPNGSGKSSVVEAVAVAVFGKTLRGTQPWHEGYRGYVEATADGTKVKRLRMKSRAKVIVNNDPKKFDTATKAQDWLDAKYGTFEVWRRTHVFSSQDAANFTMATDVERKRLLESLLDLGKFDVALSKCRQDLKAENKSVYETSIKSSRATERLQGFEGELRRLREEADQLQDPEDIDALVGEARRLSMMIEETERQIGDHRRWLTDIRADVSGEKASLQHYQSKLHTLEDDKCHVCEQPIPEELREEARETVRKAKAKLENIIKHHGHDIDSGESDARALSSELRTANAKMADIKARARAARTAKEQQGRMQERLDGATSRIEETAETAEGLEAQQHAEETNVRELEAVEQVLGFRGVRAQVLGRTLSGLESVANVWLSRIAAPGLRLKLSSYREKKTGGVIDAISLEVEGAGGGHGYRAASGGERRRIDVALLLALADIAGAVAAERDAIARLGGDDVEGATSTQGTLFFDEVFDSLDDEGIEAVSEAVAELAETRAVVVISHSDELASKLQPVQHIRFGNSSV